MTHMTRPAVAVVDAARRAGRAATVLATRALLGRTTLSRLRDDRGDVPGWVLVTLMTAGLVIAIWALARPALEGLFEGAMERVSDFAG